MSTPTQIVSNSRYIALVKSDGSIFYSLSKLPLTWFKLTFGGTGTPVSAFVVVIEGPAIVDVIKPHLCVISNDGTLWALDIFAGSWSQVINLPS